MIMFYSTPPALPPQAIVMVDGTVECKKGDRHCFPKDRVGAFLPEQPTSSSLETSLGLPLTSY
jgi:hypothetical protein